MRSLFLVALYCGTSAFCFGQSQPSADVVLSIAEQNALSLRKYHLHWEWKSDVQTSMLPPEAQKVIQASDTAITGGRFSLACDGTRSRVDGRRRERLDTGASEVTPVKTIDDGKHYYDVEKVAVSVSPGSTHQRPPEHDFLRIVSWASFGGDLKGVHSGSTKGCKIEGDASVSYDAGDRIWSFRISNDNGFSCTEKYNVDKGGYLQSQEWKDPSGKKYSSRDFTLFSVNGLWFPGKAVLKAYLGGKLLSINTYIVDVKKSRFNDDAVFDDGFFDVAITPETEVFDARGKNNIRYSGRSSLMPDDELKELAGVKTAANESSNALKYITLIVALFVIGGVVFFVRKK